MAGNCRRRRSGVDGTTKGLTKIPAGQESVAGVPALFITTPEEIAAIQPDELAMSVRVTITKRGPYRSGAGQRGAYTTAPGPHRSQDAGFLSLGMALSFFVFWAFCGAGQPSNMVRQMAFKDSQTLRRAIMMVAAYYSLIYFPLVIVFCCARILVPGMEIEPDRVMPETAQVLAAAAGTPWLAGLIMAAPFAAVMSSVDSFLLMVSSALVRDVYQRNIRPDAGERRIKRLTYGATSAVGLAAALAVLNPPQYLQSIIVFAAGGLAGCFLMPMALALFWPGITRAGVVAGMIGGCGIHLFLYLAGFGVYGRFTAYTPLGIEPFVWDVVFSAVCVVVTSRLSRPLPAALVQRFFGAG